MANRPATADAVRGCYEEQHARHDADAHQAHRRGERLGTARLLVFTLAVAVAVFAWVGTLSWALVLLPLAAFVYLVTRSAQVDAQRLDAERARDWFENGLRRLRSSWRGRGDDGSRFRDAAHAYAEDLDLFGPGSLYERLARTRTATGARVLAQALLEPPATLDDVRAQQEAVSELTPALAFRERLSRVASEAHRGTRADPLRAWTERPFRTVRPWVRASWVVTSVASTVALAGWLAGPWSAGVAALAVLVQFLVLRPHRGWVVETLQSGLQATGELTLLRRLIDTIANEDFHATRLQTAQSALRDEQAAPSAALRLLERRAAYVESFANPFFLPFALLFALPAHLACSLQTWRKAHGADCVVWSQAVAEVEALASLAGYAFEVPEHATATFLDEGTSVRAAALGHPLLGPDCVRNDVALSVETGPAGWIVSGSNMSGKSTLLRSIGTALVLAHAGAPVCARSFETTLLRLGASLHVRDVLQDGVSRFQAELIRLRRIYDLTGAGPTLFLLDEILAGTNSHDRRIGARAVVRALLDRGGIGLVTTHDLALTQLGDDRRIENVHFSDHFEGDELVFDYQLRPGVVEHSNALALMRLIGLPVKPPSGESAERTTGGSDDRSAS